MVRALVRSRADRLVANSMAVAQNMVGMRHADWVDVVPNAVDATFFEERRAPAEARRHLGLPETGLLLGVPGTLRPMKGHPFLFDALGVMAPRFAALTVVVTGGGDPPYEAELRRRAERVGGGHVQIRFLGPVDDMPAFYRACDAVCIPSRAEPFGRTVIEAFAVGAPVVASAVGGILEIVEDGETGLLAPYGDIATLATQLGRLLEDASLRDRLRVRARDDAYANYRSEVYKARLNRIAAETARHVAEVAAGSVTL